MKRIVVSFCLLGFIFFFSCKERATEDDLRDASVVADSTKAPLDSNTLYFPARTSVSDTSLLEKFSNTWYSKMLFALHEPTLFDNQDTAEVFRFTWLRTFHNPVSIRVSKSRGKCILTLKVADGSGGYEAGRIITDTSFFITMNEWKKIISKASAINFWNLTPFTDDGGKDGSEWILEGKNKNRYHFVSRWTPGAARYKEFKDCCDYLILLSNLKIADKEFY